MPRQFTTYQFDLFSGLHSGKAAKMPQWQELPEGTRQALTTLIVRLLIDHANGRSASQQKEAGHDGLTTGNGNRWTRERVTALRSYRKIPVFRPQPDGIEPWLNLGNAARLLGVAPKTLRLAAEAGEIEGVHPLPDGPWIFSRPKLATPQAQQILHRARQNAKYPAGSHPDQENLFLSMT